MGLSQLFAPTFLHMLTRVAASAAQASPATEHEPLLGAPGDVAQDERKGLAYNLVIGIIIILGSG